MRSSSHSSPQSSRGASPSDGHNPQNLDNADDVGDCAKAAGQGSVQRDLLRDIRQGFDTAVPSISGLEAAREIEKGIDPKRQFNLGLTLYENTLLEVTDGRKGADRNCTRTLAKVKVGLGYTSLTWQPAARQRS